jgi:hypothetical protein
MRRLPAPLPSPAVLSYRQAAHYLGLPSVDALRMMVYRNLAPPSIAFGKRDRRFRVVDIEGWLEAKVEASERRQAAIADPAPRGRGRPTKVDANRQRGL